MNFGFSAAVFTRKHGRALRLIFLTSLLSSLTACGFIQQGAVDEEPDTTAPALTGFEPASLANNQIDPNVTELKFYFSEPLDTSISNADSLPVNFEPAIEYDKDYSVIEKDPNNADSKEQYVLTITLKSDLTPDTTYTMSFNPGIKDLASNALSASDFSFSTPKSFTVSGNILGLEGPLKIKLEVPQQQGEETIEVQGNGGNSDTGFSFSYRIVDGNSYKATIEHISGQTVGFCVSTNNYGTINNGNGRIAIECDRVAPADTSLSYWTDYKLDSSGTIVHMGEKRQLDLPASVTSCDNIAVSDYLGVFDWACKLDAGTAIAYNTNLKAGKGLKDLIDFDAVGWKKNKIMVKQNGADIQVDSRLAIWWNNPVYKLSSGSNTLQEAGGVYIAPSTGVGGVIIHFANNHIALVAQSSLSGNSMTADAMLNVSYESHWIEGTFVSNTPKILSMVNARFVRVQNSTFNGQHKTQNSIEILTDNKAYENTDPLLPVVPVTAYHKLYNVTVYGNTGDGIVIKGNNTRSNVTLENVISSNNGSDGINIDADNVRVLNSVVAGNGANGIEVSGLDNRINTLVSNGNAKSGVYLNGSNSGYFALITASANDEYGVVLATKTGTLAEEVSRNNHLGHMTLTDNKLGAISSPTAGTGNVTMNFIDAFSAGATNVGTVAANFVGASGMPETSFSTNKYNAFPANFVTTWNQHAEPASNSGNGACLAGSSCDTIDWSLLSSSTFAAQNATPSAANSHEILFTLEEDQTAPAGSAEAFGGNGDGICDFHEACKITLSFLDNAVEIMGDGIGNDNNLCEADETCLYTPNVGSYQGQGALSDVSASWPLSGVTVKQFATTAN